MRGLIRHVLLLSLFFSLQTTGGFAQPAPVPSLDPGSAVVTGFSGTMAPDPSKPLPRDRSVVDLTFIDPEGASAEIVDVGHPGGTWNAALLRAPKTFRVTAGQVGQVFGVAIGDQPRPDLYLGATSVYGLQIARTGPNGVERLRRGAPGAKWAQGQFGVALQGGPGSLYTVDGTTGVVRLLADVMLDGVPNPGPGLGNIAFDAADRQLFVSDLHTGMIHRIGLDGADLGHFDHGVTGRTAAGLAPEPFDPKNRPVVTTDRFVVDDPGTWGFAAAKRQVWAVTLHDRRLYYSVLEGPQIWSVGLTANGDFAADARLEVEVPPPATPMAVTDIAFSAQGAMVVAERGRFGAGFYDYSAFTAPGAPQVLRFWRKTPDAPPSPGLWMPVPQEIPVGFAGDHRNPDGGVAFGTGYDSTGTIAVGACEATLLITGEKLRLAPALHERLDPGGPLPVDGVQIVPSDTVRDGSNPPWTSWFVDYDDQFDDVATSGRIGSVRTVTAPCAPGAAMATVSGGAGGGGGIVTTSPPYVDGPDDCVGADCSPCPTGTNPDGTCVGTWIPVDLAIAKTGATTPVPEVGAYSFKLTITNTGAPFTAPAGTITVTDVVPAGMTFTGATGSPGWTCAPATVPAGQTLTCTYSGGPVPSGTVGTIAITATAAGPAPFPPFTNCARVHLDPSSGMNDSDRSNNRACITVTKPGGKIDVGIKKTGVSKPGPAGTDYTFTLAMTNVGPAFTGANVITVTDVVPAGMTFTAATGAPDWTCVPAGPIPAGGTLTCTYVGTGPAAAGASLGTITVTATAPGGGPFENCAKIATSGGFVDPNQDDNKSCITVGTVDLAIAKTGVLVPVVDMPPAGAANYSYTLTITNTGTPFTVGAGVVTVTDVAPAGVTFTSVTASAGWTCTPATVPPLSPLTCTFAGGSVPSGVVGTVTIKATAKGKGPFENCSSVGLDPGSGFQDSNPANDKSCVTLTLDGWTPVDPPPPVPHACGVNVIFVVDESASVGSNAWQITTALSNAASIFNTNGAQAALIHFSDNAQLVQPMGTATWGNIATGYSPSGGTNWEAAMTMAKSVLTTAPPNTIIVFITDGIPTAFLDGSGAVQYTTDSVLATNEAVPVVNQIYAAGVPILGIGIGSVSTHLNHLLGGNVALTPGYGGLDGALTGLAQQSCPSLYLSKRIGSGHNSTYINYHGNPGPHQVPVTLTATNSGGALVGVSVEDALPPELTAPTTFVATPSVVPTVAGTVVTWPIGAMAANSSATLTFQATVTPSGPLPTDGSWHCFKNYSQVRAVGTGVVNSVPGNMANAVTGPVHEPDEAADQICVQDYDPPPPQPCTTPQLLVKKTIDSEVCRPAAQGATTSGAPCTFHVTVTAQCTDFNGPVRFGEGVFAGTGTTAVSVPIASVTSSPSTPCTWGTTTPTSCVANVTLAQNQSITFTVTLAAPIPDGSYRNCFLADGKPTVPPDFPSAYTDVNPNTSPSGGLWGNCRPFIVSNAAPAGLVAVCPPGQKALPGRGCEAPPKTCAAPLVADPSGTTCICPQGSVQRGKECVPSPTVCRPPLVVDPATGSTCICPKGTEQRGRECVPTSSSCRPPMITDPKGTGCICPQGTVQRGKECVPVQHECRRPFVPDPAGGVGCVCPEGTVRDRDRCVRPVVCRPPQVLDSSGTACRCPEGTTRKGGQCVQPTVCKAPARLNRRGDCECPAGFVAKGSSCVQRTRDRPTAIPDPVRREIPGPVHREIPNGRIVPHGSDDPGPSSKGRSGESRDKLRLPTP